MEDWGKCFLVHCSVHAMRARVVLLVFDGGLLIDCKHKDIEALKGPGILTHFWMYRWASLE